MVFRVYEREHVGEFVLKSLTKITLPKSFVRQSGKSGKLPGKSGKHPGNLWIAVEFHSQRSKLFAMGPVQFS